MAIGAVGFMASFAVESSYAGRAVLAQRVERDSAADLFDDTGAGGTRPIGSPQMYVISDERAFLPEAGPDGSKLLSDDYLKEKGIYPLQLKTVQFVASMARLGTGGVVGLGLAVFYFARRRAAKASAQAI